MSGRIICKKKIAMQSYEQTIEDFKNEGIKVISPHPGMQEKFTRSSINTVFAGGVLNPQPSTSSILTPKGFRRLSEVRQGDMIVGSHGELKYITHLEKQGEKDCIRVILEDGSSAESALDHKWWIYREGIGEMTAIGFELLEYWQKLTASGYAGGLYMFVLMNGSPVRKAVKDVQDIGGKEVICVGVSGDDQLYVTDDYIITKNCGKAQPLDAKVLTPHGFVTMGSLKEGDVICAPEGGTQTVLRVYEKGIRDVYRVFVGGVYAECCGEHLWTVIDRETGEQSTVTAEFLSTQPSRKYALPRIAEVEYSESDAHLDIAPYRAGRILGKGNYEDYNLPSSAKHWLRQRNMKEEFYIPEEYLHSGVEERAALLRGILDSASDGFDAKVSATCTVTFGRRMAYCLEELVCSLGGSITLSRYGRKMMCFITLDRMSRFHSFSSGDYGNNPYLDRVILSVRKAHVRKPMRCILVSGESHLYITDHFIPTHNTFAAILMVAEPSLDPNFRAAFTRRNLGNLKQGGGIVDDFRAAYGNLVSITTSDSPRVTFPTGAYVDCLHIADESPDKLTERAKGWQYDLFYMDELTSYEFSTFSIVGTRARGKGKFTGHVFGTTNPKKSHWTRKVLDWYIGLDGFIMPERDGVVRWYFQPGETEDDLIFGDSPEEVYEICRTKIDRQLQRLGGNRWTYKDLIRTFVFYSGKMSENTSSIENNPGYISAVSAVGGKRAEQFIEGNFNVDEEESEDNPIRGRDAMRPFTVDEQRNGQHWITIDLADIGNNNLIALEWDGFHVEDILIVSGSHYPKENAERIKMFANQHGVGESHIIYDATSAAYMHDYLPDAIAYYSMASARGISALSVARLKDECYLRLISMVNRGGMSISPRVASRKYTCAGVNRDMTVQMEWLDECAVLRMDENNYGKKKLATKKSMNAALGLGRSMDLLDPTAMRMYPVLECPYGDELHFNVEERTESFLQGSGSVDVFAEYTWQ